MSTIAILTTQTLHGATVRGRILPLARRFNGEVHVLVHRGRRTTPTDRVHLHYFGRDPHTLTPSGKIRLTGLPLSLRLAANVVGALTHLVRLKPDCLVVVKTLPESILTASVARRLGVSRTVIVDVDDFELTANQIKTIPARAAVHWAERQAVRLADAIVAASPFLVDHFRELGHKRVYLIPTGIEAARTLRSPSAPPSGQCLLYLGSLARSSGHRLDLLPDILAAVRRTHPNVALLIAGAGEDLAVLKKSFSDHGLQAVTFFGPFREEDLPSLLGRGHLIVDPIDSSLTNRAKSSYRALVAAASGLPIVTSNVGVRPRLLPRWIHDDTFAHPGDPADYAAKITWRLDHPLTPAQRTALKEHAQRWHWDRLAPRYAAILEAIVHH